MTDPTFQTGPTPAKSMMAGFWAIVGRLIVGSVFLLAGLSLLGTELRIAFRVEKSPHWIHLVIAAVVLFAAWATLLPSIAAPFFAWLVTLVRGARGAKD